MERYPSVTFEFVSVNGTSRKPRGVVIVRDAEMVLEVECPGDRPYLIRGKDRGGIYEGFHEGPEGDVPVHATWTRFGDICEGTWVEDGYDYRLMFRLTPTSQASAPPAGRPARSKGKKGRK
jgi:hypothetical protein